MWGQSQAPGASAALGGLCCAPAVVEGSHRLQKVLLAGACGTGHLSPPKCTHRAGRGHWESHIRHWGASSPMLEAQGRCTGCTGTQDPSGRCSQRNAWLTAAPVLSSVGAVGVVKGSAPLEGACGVGEVVHSPDLFEVLQPLWRTDCCGRAQVAAVITWSVCPSLHRSPQQWRCLRCPRGPSRMSLMGLPGPITLGT